MNMKLITTIILTLFAGAGFAVASERIDSVSYAFGHQYTLGIMAGKNDMMQTEQDFKDYIRPSIVSFQDSARLEKVKSTFRPTPLPQEIS